MAIRLARLGHAVLLLDRDEFPRPKPCGECLNPAAVAELDALGVLPQVLARPHERLTGWQITATSGGSFLGSFPEQQTGVAIQRAVLDAVLLDAARAAGAEVRCGERVGDLLFDGDRVTGVTTGATGSRREIAARLVIGADGLRSVVVRRLGLLRRQPRLKKLALTAHMSGDVEMHGRGELRLLQGGCIGVAAVAEGLANVTVVVDAGSSAAELAGAPAAFFDELTRRQFGLEGWRRDDEVLSTGPFDWPIRSAIADGALLVGDAAGYYDPFTGQGVYRALKGAAIAAHHAHSALTAGVVSREALAGYDRERRRAFGAGERLQRAIEAVVSRPGVMNIATRLLGASPGLADALIATAADLRPVRSLLSPRLLTDRAR
jgi:menaquinone-9 beta-reductase